MKLSKYQRTSLFAKLTFCFILTFFGIINTNAQNAELQKDSVKTQKIEGKDSNTLAKKKKKNDSLKDVHLVTRSTINDNKPLFILDGKILTELEVKNFDSKLIEKIDVLKGAGASALYGMRGQNGVVLITSKKKTLKKE